MAGDPRFFARTGPYPLARVAEAAGGSAPAAELMLAGLGPLQAAGPDELSFLDNRRYLPALKATRAGAVIVHPDMAAHVPAGTAAILTPEPYMAWAKAAALFFPVPPAEPGIHPSAAVDPGAALGEGCEIGPFASVAAGAEIGPRCRLGAGVAIGPGVVLGADCRIGAHVAISHALVGARVGILPGARIGQDGFGFASGPRGHVSVPQLGRVIIGDDVEIGANTCIDRGSAQDTTIGAGCRLDNLVQIGHNVRIGRACVIVAQVGIAGSAEIEDFVVIGGQAGVAGHLRIGKGARVGAQAGVMGDIPAGQDWVGSPAMPARETFRQIAALRRLAARGAKPG